jgi:hypothetical protein
MTCFMETVLLLYLWHIYVVLGYESIECPGTNVPDIDNYRRYEK